MSKPNPRYKVSPFGLTSSSQSEVIHRPSESGQNWRELAKKSDLLTPKALSLLAEVDEYYFHKYKQHKHHLLVNNSFPTDSLSSTEDHDLKVANSVPFLQDILERSTLNEQSSGIVDSILYFMLIICPSRCLDIRPGNSMVSDGMLYHFCLNWRGGDNSPTLHRFLTKLIEILQFNKRLNTQMGSVPLCYVASCTPSNHFCCLCDFTCFAKDHSHQTIPSNSHLNKVHNKNEAANTLFGHAQKPYLATKVKELSQHQTYRRRRRNNICKLIVIYSKASSHAAELEQKNSANDVRTNLAPLPPEQRPINGSVQFSKRALSFTLLSALYSFMPQCITAETVSRDTPLHLAVQAEATPSLLKIIQFLLEKDPQSATMPNGLSQFPFHCACIGLKGLTIPPTLKTQTSHAEEKKLTKVESPKPSTKHSVDKHKSSKPSAAAASTPAPAKIYSSPAAEEQAYDLKILQLLHQHFSNVTCSQAPHPIFFACYVNSSLSAGAVRFILDLWPQTILQKFNSHWKLHQPPFKQFISDGDSHEESESTANNGSLSARGKPNPVSAVNNQMFTPAELMIMKRGEFLTEEMLNLFVSSLISSANTANKSAKHVPVAGGFTSAASQIGYSRSLLNLVCGSACPIGILRLILSHWPDVVRIEDSRGWLTIHTLCSKKHISLEGLKLLIEKYPESVMIPTNDQNSYLPLYLLFQRNLKKFSVDLPIIDALLKAAPNMIKTITTTPTYLQPLQWLIRHGAKIQLINYFLDKFPELIEASEFNNSYPVHLLFIRGCWETYIPPTQRLTSTAHLVPDKEVITRIVKASIKPPKSGLNLLLELDRSGQIPLHLALRQYSSHPEIIQLLIDSCPQSCSVKDTHGNLPLHIALASPHWTEKTIRMLLLGNGKAVEQLNAQGRNCVQIAVEALQKRTVKASKEYCNILKTLINLWPQQLNNGRDLNLKDVLQPPAQMFILLPFGAACNCSSSVALETITEFWPQVLDHIILAPKFPSYNLLHLACEFNAGASVIRYLINKKPQQARARTKEVKPRLAIEILLTMEPPLDSQNGVYNKIDYFQAKLQAILNSYPEVLLEPAVAEKFESEDWYEDATALLELIEVFLIAVGLAHKPGVRHALHCIPVSKQSQENQIITNENEVKSLRMNDVTRYPEVLRWIIRYVLDPHHRPTKITKHDNNNHSNSSSTEEKALSKREDFLYLALILAMPDLMKDKLNSHNLSMFSIAARNGSIRACQLLLANGAELLFQDIHGRTALDYCNREQYPKCYGWLHEQSKLLRMYRQRYEMSGQVIWGGKHCVEMAKDTSVGKNTKDNANNNNSNNFDEHPEVALKFFSGKHEFQTELAIHLLSSNTDQTYVVPIIEYFEGAKRSIPNGNNNKALLDYCIVMEKGLVDLEQALEHKFKTKNLPLGDIATVGKAVGECLVYLHQKRILHGDIKLKNVISCRDTSYKLIDFDCARKFGELLSDSITPAYCSPEKAKILSNTELKSGEGPIIDSGSYDVWCFGIILLELFVGKGLYSAGLDSNSIIRECATFTEESLKQRVNLLVPALTNDDQRENFRSLLFKILTVNPIRPSMADIMGQPYFKGGTNNTSATAKLQAINDNLSHLTYNINTVQEGIEMLNENMTTGFSQLSEGLQELKEKADATLNAIMSVKQTVIPRYFLMFPACSAEEFKANWGNPKEKIPPKSGDGKFKLFSNLIEKLDVNENYKLYFLCAGPLIEDNADNVDIDDSQQNCCDYVKEIPISIPGHFIVKAAPILKAVNTLMKIASVVGKCAGIPIPYGIPILGDIMSSMNTGAAASILQSVENYANQALELTESIPEPDTENVDAIHAAAAVVGSKGKKPKAKEAYGEIYDSLQNLLKKSGTPFGEGIRVGGLNPVLTAKGVTVFVCDKHKQYSQFITDRAKGMTIKSNPHTSNNNKKSSVTQPAMMRQPTMTNKRLSQATSNSKGSSTIVPLNEETLMNNNHPPNSALNNNNGNLQAELLALRSQMEQQSQLQFQQQTEMLQIIKQIQQQQIASPTSAGNNQKSATCIIL